MLALCSFAADGMQHSKIIVISDAQRALQQLVQDNIAGPTYGTLMGLSFLKRYIQKGFNECDIYPDKVFFNECEYTITTYAMSYSQIESFLDVLSAITPQWQDGSAGSIAQEYAHLINAWKKFDQENISYRQAWRTSDWKRIRLEIKNNQGKS